MNPELYEDFVTWMQNRSIAVLELTTDKPEGKAAEWMIQYVVGDGQMEVPYNPINSYEFKRAFKLYFAAPESIQKILDPVMLKWKLHLYPDPDEKKEPVKGELVAVSSGSMTLEEMWDEYGGMWGL